MSDGISYVGCRVEADMSRCLQIRERADESLLRQWTDAWTDPVELEIRPGVTSSEAIAGIEPPL